MAHDPLADLLPAAGPATTARPARRQSIRPAAPAQASIRRRPQATAPAGDRCYMVARHGRTVLIRQFDPAAHPVQAKSPASKDRAAAWEMAQRLACPSPNANSMDRRVPAPIVFVALDGSRKQVADASTAFTNPYKAPNLAAAYARGWTDAKAGNDKDAQTTDPAEKGAYGRGFKAAK